MNSINKKSQKKRWFGISDEYQIEAMIAVLVYWDVDQAPYSAYVYETQQTFQGSISELLKSVDNVLYDLFATRFGKTELKKIKAHNSSFVTQAFYGESSPMADGFILFPASHKIKEAVDKGYVPNHWRGYILKSNLNITNKNNTPVWLSLFGGK